MRKFMIFPIPMGFIEVEASTVESAINKYRREMPDMCEQELIVAPTSHAKKTSIDHILPFWKCGFDTIQ